MIERNGKFLEVTHPALGETGTLPRTLVSQVEMQTLQVSIAIVSSKHMVRLKILGWQWRR